MPPHLGKGPGPCLRIGCRSCERGITASVDRHGSTLGGWTVCVDCGHACCPDTVRGA